MPAVSRVKDDAARLNGAIIKALAAIAVVVMLMSALTIALARPLVLTLYGAQWSHSTRPLMILAVYGSVSIICVLFANILAGLGKGTFILVVQLIWLGVLAPGMLIGVHVNGITGASIAHVIIIVPIVLPLYLYGLRKTVSLTRIARVLLPTVIAGVIAAVAARGAAALFANPVSALAAGLAAGTLVYVAVAAPYALIFLNGKLVSRLGANPVFRFYSLVAHVIGLPVDGGPRRDVASRRLSEANYLPRHARADGSYN
jgi:lipopolysaccharide exporter